MDEVFEAFISARNVDPSELGFEDNFISKEEVGEAFLFYILLLGGAYLIMFCYIFCSGGAVQGQ